MMTDRELLEAAARAAGIIVIRSRLDDPLQRDFLIDRRPEDQPCRWNPLTDDGDEARLESALTMHVDWHTATEEVLVGTAEVSRKESWGADRQAARRRAGVRAAAAIGAQR